MRVSSKCSISNANSGTVAKEEIRIGLNPVEIAATPSKYRVIPSNECWINIL